MNELEFLTKIIDDKTLSKRELLQEVCRSCSKLIPNANLVSLWVFNDTHTEIKSLINYDALSETFTEGVTLSKNDFPPYFDAIVTEQMICASDARKHSMTKCFNELYFVPYNIYSLLDFILHKDFNPTGIICCESKDKMVEWTELDIEHVSMVATMISFFSEFTH